MDRLLKSSSRKVLVAASGAPDSCIRGIARLAREHDWHLVTDMMFTGFLPREWKGDGVIAFLPYQSDLFAHVQGMAVPCVTLSGGEHPVDLPRVESDQDIIGRMAADHLLQQAHRSFAWAPSLNDSANRERFAAFTARLSEHGCDCRTLSPSHTRVGRFWLNNWSSHRRLLVAELQRLPRPTAVFAFNDYVAADIVDACRDAGLTVPNDIAVLGVGDSIACETSAVPLSSIDDNLEEVGYRAAALLERMMNGEPAPSQPVRVPPKGITTRLSTDVVAVKDLRVARALSYIAEHYPDPMLSVRDVAEAVGVSRRNLERSFREEAGCTINEHIIGIRMREASRLLRVHPRAKSSEVAALIGILGAGTFFRTFRRFFGMSPKAHRDQAAQARPGDGTKAAAIHPLSPVPASEGGVRSTAA